MTQNNKKPDRLDRILGYVGKSIANAILISALRVRGPEQVEQRDKLTLTCLYKGFRNARRQCERREIKDLFEIIGFNYVFDYIGCRADLFESICAYLEARR